MLSRRSSLSATGGLSCYNIYLMYDMAVRKSEVCLVEMLPSCVVVIRFYDHVLLYKAYWNGA